MRIQRYETTTIARTALPITGMTNGLVDAYNYNVAAELMIPEVCAGDTLQVDAVVQVTSTYTWDVMIGRYLNVATTPLQTVGTKIARPMGENFDKEIHHKMVPVFGTFVVPEAWSGPIYISEVMYTASSASTPGCTLKVDYAQITVSRFTESDI